ncbi:MAG: hypothetical protein ACQSGP_29775 [Frankia sp.]
MELVRVAGACASGACPTVFSTDGDDVVVQGYVVHDQMIQDGLPQGEAVVRLPRSVILEAAGALAAER